MSRDTLTKFGELILVAMEICRLIRFRAYVNRAAFLDDAKMDYIRCVLGRSGQRITVQCSESMWITTVRVA